ncbi:MFS transporter [Microbacterium esteraromaticum]|uniref:MFS transporter n=1 Tax=Microbacterium esteraromaticum TaxID=57043 RepID=UPI00195C2205|nr:MFS transporter [Microbacterium esteraromaticum]MBM7466814.1 Na+/melibiose symporter-like transporter [Microbacterium esteraromaticum]
MGSASNPLSRGQITRYAIGSLGTGGFATLPGLVLVYYLTDSLGVTALAAGAIVTGAKVWDVLIDPVVGGLSDTAFARSGSRRGLMLLGSIGLPIAFVLTFAVPGGIGPTASAVWVLIAFMLAATCFSLFQVPYIALPAELTDDYRERTRLLTWRVVMLTVAILLFGAGGPEIRGMFPDDPLLGYLVMAAVAAVLLGVGLFVASTVAPRRPPLPVRPGASISAHYREGIVALRESQPFRVLLGAFMLQGLATGLMLAAAQFVARWVLGDEGAVTPLFVALIAPALLMAPVWKLVADRVGKERGFRVASAVFLVATLVLGLMVWMPGWWILAPVALAGAAYAGMQTLPMAMLPDVIAHDRSSAGSANRAGVFSGVWTAGETTGMALGATVLSIVLAVTGYIETTAEVETVQPDAAVAGIAVAFSLLPAVLMLLSLVVLARYRLREHDIVGTSA